MNCEDGRFWTVTDGNKVELSHGYVDQILLTREDLISMLEVVDKQTDFSWYRGEVDTDLLEEIVKLKVKGKL